MDSHPYPPPWLLFALARDLLDHPGLMRKRLDEALAEGREVANFNCSITDVTVDFHSDRATIADVLDAEAETATLPTDALLRPFDFFASLRPRCIAFVKSEFGPNWRDAIVWLSALPDTSQDLERIVSAAVAHSRGDLDQLQLAVGLGRADWRDLLMNGGLGDEDWRTKLDEMLGAPEV